jgi:hypothetical protein
MLRRLLVGTLAGVVAWLAVPATALAHGLILHVDLPIPQWLFAWAAAVVLVVSFVALATLWPAPRLARISERPIARYPGWLEPICGALGIAFFVLIVYAGIAGSQITLSNITPTWIYVIFWVGLAFASLLFGNAFRPFNPWRALARLVAWVARRAGLDSLASEPLHYPERLGRWPAVAGLLGYAWLELVYGQTSNSLPSLLAFLSLGYAAVQLVGMSLYGIEVWTERADAFSVFYDLLGRLAPLHWRQREAGAGGEVYLRPPFIGAISLDLIPGTIPMVLAMIGTTSFDGFSNSSLWLNGNGLFYDFQSLFSSIGLGGNLDLTADLLAGTLGLILMLCVIAGFFRLGILGMRSINDSYDTEQLTAGFAHTLLPIAAAYFVAHYFSLLVFSGQSLIPLISDPLGSGANIFGTANFQANYNVLSGNALWYVQVLALVGGHAAGITLAHDRALTLYRDPRDAVRSQYWMLTVMVGFTCLGLWILSSTY